MSLRWCLPALVLALSCSDLPLPWSPLGDDVREAADAADPCNPAPLNISRESSAELPLDEPRHGQFCRGQRFWWRTPGTYADKTRFLLIVEFDRGRDAEDVDFSLGVLNEGGNFSAARLVTGSCTNPPGQNEYCLVEIDAPEAGVTDLYVVARAPDENLPLSEVPRPQKEGFSIRVEPP